MMTKVLDVHTSVVVPALVSVMAAPAAGTEFTPILALEPPTIVGHSETYPGEACDVSNLIDGQLQTEYASNGKGAETHVDFDFGRAVALSGFKHIDRNDPATARVARLIFSQEPDFSSQVGSVDVEHADLAERLQQFPIVEVAVVERLD